MGSELLGQAFTEDYYFHGRVSSINDNTYTQEQLDSGEYAGVASGSFNYGNSNPDLETRIQEDLDAFLASHPGVEASDIPADLLTASGWPRSHISLEAAKVQIAAVAEHSGRGEEVITQIVENNTEYKTAGIFGEDRVNVLKCNLEIARLWAFYRKKTNREGQDGRAKTRFRAAFANVLNMRNGNSRKKTGEN